MGYGLKIYNEDITLIIDSTYANWALWEHGESVSTASLGANHEYGATVTFSTPTSLTLLIAIKPSSSQYCGMYAYTKSGANYTGFQLRSLIDSAATIDWQAFVPRTDASSETYGLRVYDSTPTLVFDSGHAPMIITDVNTTSPSATGVSTVTHVSDANAYHIMTPDGFKYHMNFWDGSFSDLKLWKPMFKYLSATTVSFGGRQFYQVDDAVPSEINWEETMWPSTWTIITVAKSFF